MITIIEGKVLVKVETGEKDSLTSTYDHIREGRVIKSKIKEINHGDILRFGNDFIIVDYPEDNKNKYYLMEAKNIHLIITQDSQGIEGGVETGPVSSILNFKAS
jgi:hypothetical protein